MAVPQMGALAALLLCLFTTASAYSFNRELLQTDTGNNGSVVEAPGTVSNVSCASDTPSPALKLATEAYLASALQLLPADIRSALPSLPKIDELMDKATLLSLLDEAAVIAQETFNYTLPVNTIKAALALGGTTTGSRRRQLLQASSPSSSQIQVPMYVFVCYLSDGTGRVPVAKVNEQVTYMNTAFNKIGFNFKLAADPTYLQVTQSVFEAPIGSTAAATLMKQNRKGGPETLNLFLRKPLNDDGTDNLFGYASFPNDLCRRGKIDSDKLALDGLNIRYSTLPGGKVSFDPTNPQLGATAVHEAGHWVGLYHTFSQAKDSSQSVPSSGSCDPKFGDFVTDTQNERLPASGCPLTRQSCPGGPDPVTNFMDYSSDSCFTGFTPMQGARAKNQYQVYRISKRCDGSKNSATGLFASGSQTSAAVENGQKVGLWALLGLAFTSLLLCF